MICIIADDFWRSGGLLDVSDDLRSLCLQLYPEPKGGQDKDGNGYFRTGSRDFIAFAILICVLIQGYQATLGDVLQMLQDEHSLRQHALWAWGRLDQNDGTTAEMPIHSSPWVNRHDPEDVGNFITYLHGVAASVANLLSREDSRTADSFLTGARQSLSIFNITTRAHKKTQRSTFRFSDLKEGKRPTSVIIMLDPNKVEAQASVLGIIQWGMLHELKRHPNKAHPVYLLADEVTNIPWSGLASLMTWARAYGLRLFFCFQNFSAFRDQHGENTLEILQSEAEIKLFLPGQRNDEVLSYIERLLSDASIVTQSHRGQRGNGFFGLDGYDFREDGRVLMTRDEIRRTDKSILFLRRNKPILCDSPSIAEIAPWRAQVGVHPFYGKPFLKPVKLHIRRHEPWVGPLIKRFWKKLAGRHPS